MNDKWSYQNSYLRHLNLLNQPKDSLTISTQSVQELQLALGQIQKYVKHMNIGKAKIEIRLGTKSMSIDVSREMF